MNTGSKSAINDFNRYIAKYPQNETWWICSDYCLNAKNKNDVMTFVIIPYIAPLDHMINKINETIPMDLKHTRQITGNILDTLKNEMFFSFSFILDKKYYFRQFDREAFLKFSDDNIALLNLWRVNQSHKSLYYDNFIHIFNKFKEEIRKKSWNKRLTQDMVALSFLASYITYLLKKNCNVKGFCWFSDRDNMIASYNEIVYALYEIQHHTFCVNDGVDYSSVFGIGSGDGCSHELWYDSLVRVADYICGALADYNFDLKGVTHKKHLVLHEQLIADNPNLLIFNIKNDMTSRVLFESTHK